MRKLALIVFLVTAFSPLASMAVADDNVQSERDKDAKYVSRAKAKLEASNRDFVKSRDAPCSFDESLGGGAIGNALAVRRFACIAELNSRRAFQLRDLVSDRPLK